MITLWKDIPFMISILWLTFLLVKLVIDNKKISAAYCIELLLALVCTAFFRQNGILPAIVTIIFLIIYAVKKRSRALFAPVLLFMIAFLLINGPVYDYYKVIDRPGLKYFALANDIVGIYYDSIEPSDEVVDLVNEITNNNPDSYDYNPYYTAYNETALGDYSVGRFLSVYIKAFIDHPKTVMIEFLRRNSVLWSIVRPSREVAGCVNYLRDYHPKTLSEYSYGYRNANRFTEWLSSYSTSLTEDQVIFLFAWRTGIYTLILFVLLVLLIIKKKIVYLLPFAPILANLFALCISCGWTDYRYFWPTAVLTLLLFPFAKIALGYKRELREESHS
jgi:hypothetical protein